MTDYGNDLHRRLRKYLNKEAAKRPQQLGAIRRMYLCRLSLFVTIVLAFFWY